MPEKLRWQADIHYRKPNGDVKVLRRKFEEIKDLHEIIETGDDFHTISCILIVLNDDFWIKIKHEKHDAP